MELTINIDEQYIKVASGIKVKDLRKEMLRIGLDVEEYNIYFNAEYPLPYYVTNGYSHKEEDVQNNPLCTTTTFDTFNEDEIDLEEVPRVQKEVIDEMGQIVAVMEFIPSLIDTYANNDFSKSFIASSGSFKRILGNSNEDMAINLKLCELKEEFKPLPANSDVPNLSEVEIDENLED